MASIAKTLITPEEYLARERKAEFKSEYLNGEVFAMSGATREHVLICTNLIIALGSQLRKKACEVYTSDMRVRVRASGLYTYPDLSVVYGKPLFDDKELDTLLNPLLVVEVLSRTTSSYDRGPKFSMYRKLDSLKEWLFVEQEVARVEQYVRQPGGKWLMTEAAGLKDSLKLASVPVILKLRSVYRQVEFPSKG